MKKKLKILIISQYFWPENFRINDLVKELSKKGHEITVLTGKPNYPEGVVFPEYTKSPQDYNRYGDTSIIRVPILPRGNGGIRLFLNYISFFISASTLGVLKLKNSNFDIIFVFEPSPITVGIPAVFFKKIKKAPIVFWVLDLWPETLSAVGVVKSKKVLAIVGNLVSYIYRNCSLILGQSEGFENEINKYCTQKDRFRYFPNWTESIFEEDTNKQIAPEIRIENGVFNIVFTGNIGESQDFPSILDTAESISYETGVRWYIVGSGRMSSWLKGEINKRSLENRFFLLGRYPLERMPAFYNAASALLVTLKSEPVFSLTIPGKVQSYMAAGKPILSMLDGEGSKIITKAKSGLTASSGNSEILKENIEKMLLLTDKELLQMGENGRRYAKKEFSKELLISKLESWLIEVSK